MNAFSSLALAALVTSGFAAPASAFSFTPKNTHFTTTGTLRVFGSPSSGWCDLKMNGTTTKTGEIRITRATIIGGGIPCVGSTPSNLPYRLKAIGAGSAVLSNVSITGAYFGRCGPGAVAVSVISPGQYSLSQTTLPGGCSVGGSFTTTPTISQGR